VHRYALHRVRDTRVVMATRPKSGPTLFAAAGLDKDAPRPLADRLRPQKLDEVVGQDHLLGPDGALTRMLSTRSLGSLVFWGPPGTGKTTVARLLAQATDLHFEQISAIFTGVADLGGTYLERRGIEVVGRARDGEEAVALLEEKQPAVALVDLLTLGEMVTEINLEVVELGPEPGALGTGAEGAVERERARLHLVHAQGVVVRAGQPLGEAALAVGVARLEVDVVDDENLGLCGMPAVETTDILSQRAFPGYGHREEERVEPLIVKALTKIAPRGEDEPFLIIRYSKGCLGYLALDRGHPTPKDNEIAHEAGKATLEVFEMVPPLSEHDR